MRSFFFFNDTATTEIYTLSLHDALPICVQIAVQNPESIFHGRELSPAHGAGQGQVVLENPDRKSTRLNSSHANISYADFCLKINEPKRPIRELSVRSCRLKRTFRPQR